MGEVVLAMAVAQVEAHDPMVDPGNGEYDAADGVQVHRVPDLASIDTHNMDGLAPGRLSCNGHAQSSHRFRMQWNCVHTPVKVAKGG
eukprot:1876766-Alexandrium_andersonii.AAC.1